MHPAGEREAAAGDSGSCSEPPSPLLAPLPAAHGGGGGGGGGARAWLSAAWQQLAGPQRESQPPPFQSQYLTLIPLSDARLKPRRTKLIVFSLLLLSVTASVGVFLAVPRGVSVGSIEVHSTRMTFNATTLTYRIILQADVPVYNPNYLKASISGNVTVSFFDAEAGWSALGPVTLSARTEPKVVSVKVDASNLSIKYTQVVYTHCFNFPRKLIFFLLGTFKATYLGHTSQLPSIDTYFMLDCSGANDSRHHRHRGWAAPEHGRGGGGGGAAVLAAGGVARRGAQLQRLAVPAAAAAREQALAAGSLQEEQLAWGPGEPVDWELELPGVVATHGRGGGALPPPGCWRGAA